MNPTLADENGAPLPVKFKISIELTEYDDGSISVQELRPDGPISEFYGEYFAGPIIDKMGVLLLNRDLLIPGDPVGYVSSDEVVIYPQSDTSRAENASFTSIGHIYLLAGVGTGWYKIGLTTKTPDERIKQFAPKLPFDTEVVHIFPALGVKEAETLLHEKYKHLRVNGEWFSLDQDAVNFIRSITEFDGGWITHE